MNSDEARESHGETASFLRVLHLEDNASDRELVRGAFEREGFGCEFVYADSRDAFARALEQGRFDLVLSDFTIPGYDGLAALALAREKCPEVPYLFVSGTIGEERAIESLRSGATDYVLKDRIDRLLPAVRRALREAGERAKRRAAEAALREAEARFRGIVENAVVGIYQVSPQGKLLRANRTMAQLCGYGSPEEICEAVTDMGRDVYVEQGHRAALLRILDESGELLGCESRIRRRDGATIWISENARVVRDARGLVMYYEGIVTDITSRKAAEAALRLSEERFREMAESIDQVFWIAVPDAWRWLYVSPAYETIWGMSRDTLYRQPDQWLGAVVADDRPKVRDALERLAQGDETRIEYRIRQPEGALRWIEDRRYPVREDGTTKRVVGVAMDITRRKQLESQLLQAQKMEAVGQLAGGVAHDFNNVLTVVTGYARLLLDADDLPADAVTGLTQIYNAGTRAANLTRQLLLFSRKQAVHRRIIELNEVVEEIVKMLCRLIGEHIALQLSLAPSLPTIDADVAMMEQVMLNLAVNARDAMAGGGQLTIATESLTITDPAARHHPAARAGEFVCLRVCDTGCGIPPENLERIFEPFFTTKAVGHGTGLGLATVFGIVQQHQGWIEVESTVNAGTCFRVILPSAGSQAPMPARRPAKTAATLGGTETMLLVEDDLTVREFAVAVLKSHGYRVLQAGTGVEALDVWKWHQARIALLFTDLVMPDGLGGVELAAMLRKDKPTLRVVLTSGYASEAIEEEGFRPPPGTHFIHKPYQPQVLAQTIRDALNGTFDR